LGEALDAVMAQVGRVVIVDHGAQGPEFEPLMARASAHGAVVLRHPDNPGLAAGFNRGIEHARLHGFDFVLLLDQDSIPAPDMVRHLLAAWRKLSASARVPVAALGPQWFDARNAVNAPFVRFGFPFNRKIPGVTGQPLACDFLISSGSLIPLEVLDEVGMMDESLFIDNIDMDWCMRASAKGHALYGIAGARMRHTIGDGVRPSRWRRGGTFIHSPLRLYYSTRNRVWLYRRPYVPWVWIAQDMPRLVWRFLRMSLLIAPRRAHARAMLYGLRDGAWRRFHCPQHISNMLREGQ